MSKYEMTPDEEATLRTEEREFAYFAGKKAGIEFEQTRIIKLLIELNAIRRDALGYLVAFNTHGTEVIYLTGLEKTNE